MTEEHDQLTTSRLRETQAGPTVPCRQRKTFNVARSFMWTSLNPKTQPASMPRKKPRVFSANRSTSHVGSDRASWSTAHQRRRRSLTPAQGWSASLQPWDPNPEGRSTLKGFLSIETLSGFGRDSEFFPQGSRETLEPWAEISERLRRIFSRASGVAK